MTAMLLRLFPDPVVSCPLEGLYLQHALHQRGEPGRPFIYGNFVSSLDGRIALRDPAANTSWVPSTLTNAQDWWLFRELQVQADCFITHGGYLRALANGELDSILQVGLRADERRLSAWRAANGLTRQPAVVIASASLDFPLPESLMEHRQEVVIVTGAQAIAQRIAEWRERELEVVIAGTGQHVEGRLLHRFCRERAWRSIYLQAGPLILQTLLQARALNSLYLTMSHQLLGGTAFHSLIAGPEMGRSGRLRLRELYYDHTADEDRSGQFFACFEPAS